MAKAKAPPKPLLNTTGGKLVFDVLGERKKVTRRDKIELAVRIDGWIKIATGEERHRCFEILQGAVGEVMRDYSARGM